MKKGKLQKIVRSQTLNPIFNGALSILLILILFKSCAFPDAVYANEISQETVAETMYHQGTIAVNKDDLEAPSAILEQNGEFYELLSTDVNETTAEGTLTFVSAIVPYELEGEQEPPERTTVTLKDERSEKYFDRELQFLEIIEKDVVWKDTFEFPITVSDYDAESYWLGDIEIPKDTDLSKYGEILLQTIGLSTLDYRVDSVEWVNESYEKDGKVFRDAVARGEKRIRYVDVKYGDTIRTPDTIGYQYISCYKKIEKGEAINTSGSNIDVLDQSDATAIPEDLKRGLWEAVIQYLQEHMVVVTVGSLFLLILLTCLGLIVGSKNRDQREKQLKSWD